MQISMRMQYGTMHHAPVTTNRHQIYLSRSEDFREALSNIARQARSLFQNFNDSNVQPIEQRMLEQRPRDSGNISTRTPSSSQTNVNNSNVESTAVAAQLKCANPQIYL